MRVVISLTLLLITSCYDSDSAIKTLRRMGRPEPIECNYLDARSVTYACHDGEGVSWICSENFGCTRWGVR